MDRYDSTHYSDDFVVKGRSSDRKNKARGRSRSRTRGERSKASVSESKPNSSKTSGSSTLRIRSFSRGKSKPRSRSATPRRGGGRGRGSHRREDPDWSEPESTIVDQRGAKRDEEDVSTQWESRGHTVIDPSEYTNTIATTIQDQSEYVTTNQDQTTRAGETTKFTNVTIQSFLPKIMSSLELGQSIFAEAKGIKTWNVEFLMHQMLSGLSVMSCQFPECISYAYIAGIDPLHALQATWIANVLTSMVGGSPGLMSSTSGLGAIVIRFVARNYGLEYIFYVVMLSGFCHVVFGALRFGKYLRLLPSGVTIGMINALSVMSILLQLRYFKEFPGANGSEDASTAAVSSLEETIHVSSTTEEPTRNLESIPSTTSEDNLDHPWAYFYGYDLQWTDSTSQIIILFLQALATIVVCFLLPRFVTILPSSLVAIVVLSLVNFGLRKGTNWVAPNVGDYTITELPSSQLWQGIFHSSYKLPPLTERKTFKVVFPAGLSLFCVHLLESMVAINTVDEYTSTESEQDRVFYGQGIANMIGGLMGGMGSTGSGHASLHSLRMGGVTSTSVFFAGIYMLMVFTFAYPAVSAIPLGATMGVAIYLVWNMIQWKSIISLAFTIVPNRCLKKRPALSRFRLATPHLLSTFITSVIALFGNTYALAGYVMGILCYACDLINRETASNDDGDEYNSVALHFPKTQANGKKKRKEETEQSQKAKKKTRKMKKKWRAPISAASRTSGDYTKETEEPSVGPADMEEICEAICGDLQA